jgi:hypothetical protein
LELQVGTLLLLLLAMVILARGWMQVPAYVWWVRQVMSCCSMLLAMRSSGRGAQPQLLLRALGLQQQKLDPCHLGALG